MLESTFELAVPKPITDEYNYCVAHLSPDAAMAVRDVILSPGSINPYSKLKLLPVALLPPNVQSILASIQPLTAQKASEGADRILEVLYQNIPAPILMIVVNQNSSKS
ncbi:hypothetical protein TNCV_3809561 [Trichonephila clavipes]|nr:hypothetical protein TNCV_3809561 [Trichonephila clavipes]